MPKPATILQLKSAWQEDSADFELVHEDTGPDDHGYSYRYVFLRHSDDTYWSTSGVCQGGGDYHELREGCGAVTQVFPHVISKTEYRTTPAT